MNRFPLSKKSVLAAALALAVSACSMNDTRDDYADEPVRTERARVADEPARPATAPKRTTAPAVVDRDVDVDVDVDDDDVDVDIAGDVDGNVDGKGITGVEACDEYLTRYRGCHRVIGAFGPEDIEKRYQTLRASLLERSLDPAQREALAANCQSLSGTMEEALNDRDCLADEVPVADSDDLSDDGLEGDGE